MTLFGNTALLERLLPAQKSSGGILLPERCQDDRLQYYVLAVGPGKRRRNGCTLPPEVRVGDKCICNPDSIGVKHKFEDGRIIVDADIIQMIFK